LGPQIFASIGRVLGSKVFFKKINGKEKEEKEII
jgi:hypothetical protein